jgi:acyl dehydratase
MRIIQGLKELEQLVGTEVGVSEWFTITQERIDDFADITEDHQWIHVDPERATRDLPGGRTIAHGFLTLSMIPHLSHDVFRVEGVPTRLNYGLNRVRFTSPVPVGSRIRGRFTLASIDAQGGNRYLVTTTVTIEIEGEARPACVAETLALYLVGDRGNGE